MIKYVLSNIIQIYYIVIITALAVSYIIIRFVNKMSKLEGLYLLSSYMFSIFGMIIGAKALFSIETIIFQKSISFSLLSGFSYMGGVLSYIIFNKLYNKLYKEVPNQVNELLLLAIPLIYSISKIACYFSGCCTGIMNIPIQLIECIIYFIIFLIFLFLYKKYNYGRLISYTSTIVLCFCRYLIDFFRVKRQVVFFNTTLTQIVCIITICLLLTDIYKIKKC